MATSGLVQRAVSRKRGCNSSEILCNFAALARVQAVVNPLREAAGTLSASGG